MSLMDPAADTAVFAFGILADDDPVEVFGSATLQRTFNARQQPGWADIGVLVESLADLEAQAPQRDVIGNVRVAGGSEQDSVLAAQGVEAIVRHHHAVLAVVIAAPVEILEFKAERLVDIGEGFENLLAGGNDFLANTITRDGGDAIDLHEVFLL